MTEAALTLLMAAQAPSFHISDDPVVAVTQQFLLSLTK